MKHQYYKTAVYKEPLSPRLELKHYSLNDETTLSNK